MTLSTPPSIPVSPSPVTNSLTPSHHKQDTQRRRGGQPGNQNARKNGTFSLQELGPLGQVRLNIRQLSDAVISGSLSLAGFLSDSSFLLEQLCKESSIDADRLIRRLIGLRIQMKQILFYFERRKDALSLFSQRPLLMLEIGFKDYGISRDADSFFPVSEKSAKNSLIPFGHPQLATNLTDDQWAVLAPLFPPDPAGHWLTGEPPLLIAANRWEFSPYLPDNDSMDREIMQRYWQTLQRFPALLVHAPPNSSTRSRGRPHACISPRPTLDAILWKLTTGHTWNELPSGFPPVRLCRDVYRRLFLSGRLYTLLLALYNHLTLEAGVNLEVMLNNRSFVTTPDQKIALHPDTGPSRENYTALLFMQMARDVYVRHARNNLKAAGLPRAPHLAGNARLSTGVLPVSSSSDLPTSQVPFPTRDIT